MEIDHIFVFVDQQGPELQRLAAAGLVETYRRQHPGQGTANACFCFDNIFVELLWLTSAAEAASDPIKRTLLLERSRWRDNGACPFGIAWRAADGQTGSPFPTWPFRPPYLPPDRAIDVALDSDDPRQPMMFTFPGTQAPSSWPDARKGQLQRAAGLASICRIALTLPPDVQPSGSLNELARRTNLVVSQGSTDQYVMRLDLSDALGRHVATLSLPDCRITDSAAQT
jgi:Glyoxalase-like domain